MICQNCHATVDNDLVFCTNCGARLAEPIDSAQTIAMNESRITNVSSSPPAAKSSSPLKWVALIVALIALPASLGIAYLLLKNSDSSITAQNVNKATPENRKTTINTSSKNVNALAANANSGNANLNSNVANNNANSATEPKGASVEIFNDQLEIQPGSSTAYSFTVSQTSKITGNLQTTRGEPVQGYVFFQSEYDQHFPDATYKVFSFEDQNADVEQTLVKGDYVLVFQNKSQKSAVIKGQFKITPSPKDEKN